MVMVMMMVVRLSRKHPRLPAHVAAVMVATLAHMPPSGSFRFARRLSSLVIGKSINTDLAGTGALRLT
jgi:hypothetical protein